MSTDAVVLSLKSLKLFGMAGAVAELAEQGAPAYHQSTGLLNQLIKAEVADREVRSINYQMKVARFPAHRDLSGFIFNDSAVNEALVRTLHRCKFLDQTENIVRKYRAYWRSRHRQDTHCHRYRCGSDRPSSPAGKVPVDR